jgi:hypothetical protein
MLPSIQKARDMPRFSYGISRLCPIISGVAAACCRPFRLPYAPNRDGKISSLVMGSSLTSVSTMVSKQQSHFQQRQT